MSEAADNDSLIKMLVDGLEELLLCPVCFKLLKSKIYMCNNGHPICEICRSKMKKCGLCNKVWSREARNYLSEAISKKLAETKKTLFSDNSESDIKFFEKPSTSANPVVNGIKYCRIEDCDFAVHENVMLQHIAENHARNIFQWYYNYQTELYHYEFQFTFGNSYDAAGYTNRFGLVFINVFVDEKRNLLVQVKAVKQISHRFSTITEFRHGENVINKSDKLTHYLDDDEKFKDCLTFGEQETNLQNGASYFLSIYLQLFHQ